MERSIVIIILIALASLALGTISRADLVYLQNGKVIDGEISETVTGMVLIKGKGGTFTVDPAMVLRIVQQNGSESESIFNWYLEVGSVIRYEEAETIQSALNSLGYPSVQIVDDPPYYRVWLGPVRKESETIAIARRIASTNLPIAGITGRKLFRLVSEPGSASISSTAVIEQNIALSFNGARVTTDSQLVEYPAENAIDGNSVDLASRWVSDSSFNPHWLEVEFGTMKPFSRIELYTGEAHQFDYLLRDFSLQYWSGTEWIDIPGTRKKNNLIENPIFTFTELTAQKVRLYITHGSKRDNIARVYELRILTRELFQPKDRKLYSSESIRNYQVQLLSPTSLLTSKPTIIVATTTWYPLFCSVRYTAENSAVFTASILPEATEFWTNADLRRSLEISADDYHTTIHFDTEHTPGYSNLRGSGTISFQLKSKSPASPGLYQKILRISLLNPENRSSLVFQEIPFTLQVE
ncbi:MAG: discoidin domain-containing protein [bacterium]|nr:discoidin domain-containing protein [bacterium]